jgi:hypothetical protein
VKRFLGAILVVVLLLLGIGSLVFGVVDFFRLFSDTVFQTPTTGTYHEPLVTALTVASGVAGVLLTIGLLAVATKVRDGIGSAFITGCLTLSVMTAVTGLWLPFIHANEVDIASSGFRQPYYSISRRQQVTLYNATAEPITVCVGTRSHCTTTPFAPAQLNGAGLRLAAGEAVDISLSGGNGPENDVPMADGDWAAYTVTIATPAPGMTQVDTAIHALYACADYADSDC